MRAANVDIMLMEPQWCPMLDKVAGSDQFGEAVRRIGAEMGVPVIRRSDLMHRWIDEKLLTREQMLSNDGLHMADRGYALLANDVAEEILGAVDGLPVGAGSQMAASQQTIR